MDILYSKRGKNIVRVYLEDEDLMNSIEELEKDVFGEEGAANRWVLAPFAEFGKVYALIDEWAEVIGSAQIFKAWDGLTAHLYGIAIKRDLQGQGLGTLFLRTIMLDLKKDGVKKINLTVSPSNVKAIKLYEKLGFKRIKLINDLYGKGKDRYIMEAAL